MDKNLTSFCVKQIINHYRVSVFDDNKSFNVNCTDPANEENLSIQCGHNEGLDSIMNYIRHLESELERYKCIENDVVVNCSDNTDSKDDIRANNLIRQLKSFAAEHQKEEIDYIDGAFEISYDVDGNMFKVELVNIQRYFGSIPFDTEETAELAIKEFYDELIWYFTEYDDGIKYL